MSEERFVELESRIAFQEESIQALNQSLQQQQRAIENMELTIVELQQRLRSLRESPLGESAELNEPPPPHY
jgi:SlyX protein